MKPALPPDPWLKLIQDILYSSQKIDENTIEWPENGGPAAAGWRQIVETLLRVRQLTASLAEGDLAPDVRVVGALGGQLKTLQASLRHLTWQVQQVAAGDLTQQVDFLGDFSAAFNQMIQNLRQARLIEAEQREMAEALRVTAAALNSAMSLESVLDSLLNNLERVVPHENALILMIDENQSAYPVRWSGFDYLSAEAQTDLPQIRLPIVLTPNLRSMVESGRPCCIDDVRQYDWQITPISGDVRAYLSAPVFVESKAAGFLSLYSRTPGFFNEQHVERLEIFADQAAIAIQKAHMFDELQRMALTDPLTGAPNRRAFFDQGEAEFSRTVRYATQLAALMLDADHFKPVNDTYGHAAGDEVLRQIVHICRDSLRQGDIFGRYGGEEFAVLLPHTDENGAAAVAERIRSLCASRCFDTLVGPVRATVSIGAASYEPGTPSLQVLLNRADQALYAAKEAGRNCVRTFTSTLPRSV